MSERETHQEKRFSRDDFFKEYNCTGTMARFAYINDKETCWGEVLIRPDREAESCTSGYHVLTLTLKLDLCPN